MIPIYDPLTGQPFPGNVIPHLALQPLSASILTDIPDPNRSGLNGGNLSNIGPQIPALSIKQNLWGYTIDHKITDSQTIRFSEWRAPLNSATLSSANVAPATSPISSLNIEPSLGSGWLLNYVKTFSPNLVMTWGAVCHWSDQLATQRPAKCQVPCRRRQRDFSRTSPLTGKTPRPPGDRA